MATSASFDCRACGACCVNSPSNQFMGFTSWVEVEAGDAVNEKLVVRDAHGVPHLRLTDDGRCISLRGTMGENTSCAIYDDRPSPCRRVQPGDALCKRYRHEHGLDQ